MNTFDHLKDEVGSWTEAELLFHGKKVIYQIIQTIEILDKEFEEASEVEKNMRASTVNFCFVQLAHEMKNRNGFKMQRLDVLENQP